MVHSPHFIGSKRKRENGVRKFRVDDTCIPYMGSGVFAGGVIYDTNKINRSNIVTAFAR